MPKKAAKKKKLKKEDALALIIQDLIAESKDSIQYFKTESKNKNTQNCKEAVAYLERLVALMEREFEEQGPTDFVMKNARYMEVEVIKMLIQDCE